MDQFRATSTDQINWYAQVWSNYAKCYVAIGASPAFTNPDQAIVWAFEWYNYQ